MGATASPLSAVRCASFALFSCRVFLLPLPDADAGAAEPAADGEVKEGKATGDMAAAADDRTGAHAAEEARGVAIDRVVLRVTRASPPELPGASAHELGCAVIGLPTVASSNAPRRFPVDALAVPASESSRGVHSLDVGLGANRGCRARNCSMLPPVKNGWSSDSDGDMRRRGSSVSSRPNAGINAGGMGCV